MGSYSNAVMIGFICRLCSEQRKNVTHIYSAKAKKLGLTSKLGYLPIQISKYDSLPKTICDECIHRIELQYALIKTVKKSYKIHETHRRSHGNGNCPLECPLYGS